MKLNTRYAVYFSGVLLFGAVFMLLLIGIFLVRDGDRFHLKLQNELRYNLLLDQQDSLSATAEYLGQRLFNPLRRLDIDALDHEIAEIRVWLPVNKIEITDPQGLIVTDGSEGNVRRGQRIDDERIGRFDLMYPHIYSFLEADGSRGGIGISFGVRRAGVTAGFIQIVLSENALLASVDRIPSALQSMWESALSELFTLAVAAILAAVLAAVLLSWGMSRRLSWPLTEMSKAAKRFAAGDLSYVIPIVSRDEIGELAGSLNSMARELRKNSSLLVKSQEIAGVGGWEFDSHAGRFAWSSQAARIFGVPVWRLPISRAALRAFIHPESRDAIAALFTADYSRDSTFSLELRALRADGAVRTLQVIGEVTPGRHGEKPRVIGAFQDITERKQSEAQLLYLASFDTLTGLPNRSLFQDRLRHGLLQADRRRTQLILLFLDLDRFKTINDTPGHAAGDELLRQVALRLTQVVREADTVARLGGDEFTIILDDLQSGEDAAGVARKVLDALQPVFRLDSHEVFVSASIGITVYPDDASQVDTLLKNADAAMYLAKEEGRNTYCFFTAEMNVRAHERLALETALRGALGRREFVLFYQPQIDIRSGDLVGFEALLRWRRADGTLVSPADFIPLLEDTGLIVKVGAWVIAEACRWLAVWNGTHAMAASVAVNVSARQFHDANLVATVSKALRESGVPASALELEITESCLVDEPGSLNAMHALHGLGIRLAIDDFGTGYSSLSYLKRFPVDKLKIDQSFVHDITEDRDAAAIVSAILALSHNLQLQVVAEGVETAEQLGYLRRHGCDEIQGYLIASPLAPAALAEWYGTYLADSLAGQAQVIPLRARREQA